MKRIVVILSVMLVLCCAFTSAAEAHCVWICNQNMKLLVQEIYPWELSKSCDIVEPVSLPVGESVDAHYRVTATRGKPQTIRTVELGAKVSGARTVKVCYNGKTYDVDVVDGKIKLELPYACGVNRFSVKAGCLTFKYCRILLPTVKKEQINATATLRDKLDPAPEGLAFELSERFKPARELKDCKNNTYLFEYTVTVRNQSSYGKKYTLNNEASLELMEGEPLKRDASFGITTPKKPEEPKPDEPDTEDIKPEDPKLDPGPDPEKKEQKPAPKPETKRPLPQTDGGYGFPGLLGVLMTAAGVYLRKKK